MTETVREVPLSLQVFHSHNEYKAHRRNRTEQIYLRDLSAGLGREEKLYVKEYAFQRSSFHRHYARRFSAPLLSAPPTTPSRAYTAPGSAFASTPRPGTSRRNLRSANSSVFVHKDVGNGKRPVSQPSPRASLFSASASLRHASASTKSASSSTPLAARMLDGLKEVSVSTRFQRIQRKFSIASMTENGCLTAEGNSLADDIQEARKRLFNRGGSVTKKFTNVRDSNTTADTENNGHDSMTKAEEERKESEEKTPEMKDPISNAKSLPTEINADNIHQVRSGINANEKTGTPHVDSLSKSEETHKDERDNAQQQHSLEIDPRMKMPFLKLRASLNFSKQRNSKPQGHVTIAEPIPEDPDSGVEEKVEEDPVTDDETPQPGLFSHQTSSIFKRFLSNTPYTEPLQLKIREFLQDQAKFNHRFPKGQENRVDQSERHKELLSGEKEKKERLQKEQEQKKELVFEVLTKLGITDEHIWFHYNQ